VTKYRLLAANIDDHIKSWRDWGTIEATSAEAAIRNAYMKNPDTDVKALVAVPERSWKPTLIRTENVTRLIIGERAEKEEN